MRGECYGNLFSGYYVIITIYKALSPTDNLGPIENDDSSVVILFTTNVYGKHIDWE